LSSNIREVIELCLEAEKEKEFPKKELIGVQKIEI